MKTVLIGSGYWGSILKKKLSDLTELLCVVNSKDNLDDVLQKYDADFVFVCTPTKTHYDIVKKCIHYKKNVFCEKPFTGSLKKAKELFLLAENNNLKIFVDNIFLFRREMKDLIEKKFKTIKFIWNKKEEVFKEDLFNTLLYHDLYLLISLSDENWSIKYCSVSDDKLSMILDNNEKTSYVFYDRYYEGSKEKKIYLDDTLIDFSNPLDDPLSEIIIKLNENNYNLHKNKEMTLKSLKLLNRIKNECLLYTSENIN